jgi:hypothetical protein
VNFRRSVLGATVPFRLFMTGGTWLAFVTLAGGLAPFRLTSRECYVASCGRRRYS